METRIIKTFSTKMIEDDVKTFNSNKYANKVKIGV